MPDRTTTLCFEGDGVFMAILGDLEPFEVDEQLRLLTRSLAIVPRFVLRNAGCHQLPEVTDAGPV